MRLGERITEFALQKCLGVLLNVRGDDTYDNHMPDVSTKVDWFFFNI